VGYKRIIQLADPALGYISPPVKQAKAIRYPADQGEVLLGQQHR
jgi:hypothetical protein